MKIGTKFTNLFKVCIMRAVGIDFIPYESSYILVWMGILFFNLYIFTQIRAGRGGWNYIWLGLSILGIAAMVWIGKKYGIVEPKKNIKKRAIVKKRAISNTKAKRTKRITEDRAKWKKKRR